MVSLGIWTGRRASAVVADGTAVLAAAEDTWITRKSSSGFPAGAVDAVLDAAGLRLRDVERVVVVSRFPLRWTPAVRRCRILAPISGISVERALSTALAAGAPEFEGAAAVGAAFAGEKLADGTLAGASAWGPAYDEQACYRALSAASLPRDKVDDADAVAASLLASNREVVRFSGRLRFGFPGPERCVLLPARVAGLPTHGVGGMLYSYRPLLGVDGIICCSPGDAVRWWRAGHGQSALIGPWLLRRD